MPRKIKCSGSVGLKFEFYLRHVSSSFSASVGMFLALAFISVLQNVYDQGSKEKTSGVEACSRDHDICLAGFLAVFYEVHCQLKGVDVAMASALLYVVFW